MGCDDKLYAGGCCRGSLSSTAAAGVEKHVVGPERGAAEGAELLPQELIVPVNPILVEVLRCIESCRARPAYSLWSRAQRCSRRQPECFCSHSLGVLVASPLYIAHCCSRCSACSGNMGNTLVGGVRYGTTMLLAIDFFSHVCSLRSVWCPCW